MCFIHSKHHNIQTALFSGAPARPSSSSISP